MKKWAWPTFIVVIIVSITTLTYYKSQMTPSQTYHQTFRVNGMFCESCDQKITQKLKKIPQILDINVDRKNHQVQITSKEQLSPNIPIQAINALGYKASLPIKQGKLEVIDYKITFQ